MALVKRVTVNLSGTIPGGGDNYGAILNPSAGGAATRIEKRLPGTTPTGLGPPEGPGRVLVGELDVPVEASAATLWAKDVEGAGFKSTVELWDPNGALIISHTFPRGTEGQLQEVTGWLPATPEPGAPAPRTSRALLIGGVLLGFVLLKRRKRR